MNQSNNEDKPPDKTCTVVGETNGLSKTKPKYRKRKCVESTSSSDGEDILPENILETEKNLHASAVKNNLDETSVRKILKKVVTNDHVLALVKLREEEEKGLDTNENKPTKLTRSKIKELMKVSPKPSSWKTWDLQLTPIKHIPVKTRPEVTALIAQDLPEDEDDDEYEPNHDDAPSDDDQTVESCSDIESQPRTPATPKSQDKASPKVVKDGPFVVPQKVSGTKRKLELDEEDATIARRTRSKLSLSSTSIEHIESTFVPPDELPMPAVDDLWNQFLNECLNPASAAKNEDDDEADPEYNAAADADAADEDDENLGKSIIKISKKELNDLVTELFGIMPEAIENDELAENLATTVLTDNSQTDLTHWEGKQEPLSDEEEVTVKISGKLTFEKREPNTKLSIGKTALEVEDSIDESPEISTAAPTEHKEKPSSQPSQPPPLLEPKLTPHVKITVKEQTEPETPRPSDHVSAPPILRYLKLNNDMSPKSEVIQVEIGPEFTFLPEQIQILQQQLRQHIQLATSNFLQLYVHPMHWSYGPPYKKYIETFINMCNSNPHSVANVCNLRPALDLMTSWEKSVAEDTPVNAEMIKFIQADCEKSRRRLVCNNLYNGDFHDTYKNVVANSTVFLYPYLLPPSPFRGDAFSKKFQYLRSEDELIAIGLDEFWQYVESNPKLFKLRMSTKSRRRPGLFVTVQLVVKHMFPWILPKVLMNHILHVRKNGDTENPITKFFKSRKVVQVKHKLLPFNPKLSLYEQPENEMPRTWLRYLAKTSKRFKAHLYRSSQLCGRAPEGVTVTIGKSIEIPKKNPLPIDFTKEVVSYRPNQLPKPNLIDKFDVNINNGVSTDNVMMAANLYSVVETSTGAFLVPLSLVPTNTVNSTNTPICSSAVIQGTIVGNNLPENSVTLQEKTEGELATRREEETLKTKPAIDNDHCECCKILRKICDGGQTLIFDFFKPNKSFKRHCYCKDIKRPKITNRLKLFLSNYKCQSKLLYQEIENKLTSEEKTEMENGDFLNANDLAFVTLYQLRVLRRINSSNNSFKNRIHGLFLKFNIGKDDPVQLAKNLHKAVNGDLIEIYIEFLGFLTAEQAEKEDVFNAYLASHLRDLIKMIDEEMTDKEKRDAVLNQLKTIFTNKNSTPCQTCSALLSKLEGFPRIAKHLFGLFPHTREARCTNENNEIIISNQPEPSVPPETTLEHEENHATVMNDVELPAVQRSGSIQITSDSKCIIIQPGCEDTMLNKTTNDSDEEMIKSEINENEEMRSDCSDPPMVIIEEDIKCEPAEWKRDEDKLILEMLKESLTPEERNNKTIIEILEEKNLLQEISDCLIDKTIDEIHERILYLLEILVLSEKS